MDNDDDQGVASPAALAAPPADLGERDLPLKVLDPGAECGIWIRLYDREYPSALYFGRVRPHPGRFDAPGGEYGVLYAGLDIQAAFIETFGDQRDAAGHLRFQEEDLDVKAIAEIPLIESLQVVDLTAEGLAAIGADEQLCASVAYPVTRQWSLALWAHPDHPDGLFYRARHDPSRLSLAVFDRSEHKLGENLLGSLAADINRRHLAAILATYPVQLM